MSRNVNWSIVAASKYHYRVKASWHSVCFHDAQVYIQICHLLQVVRTRDAEMSAEHLSYNPIQATQQNPGPPKLRAKRKEAEQVESTPFYDSDEEPLPKPDPKRHLLVTSKILGIAQPHKPRIGKLNTASASCPSCTWGPRQLLRVCMALLRRLRVPGGDSGVQVRWESAVVLRCMVHQHGVPMHYDLMPVHVVHVLRRPKPANPAQGFYNSLLGTSTAANSSPSGQLQAQTSAPETEVGQQQQ